MLEKGYRYEFIAKHSYNCTNEQLYKNYFHYLTKYFANRVVTETEGFTDLLWYLKQLIIRNKPEDFIKFIDNTEYKPYSKKDIESTYIYFMMMVALIHLHFCDDYEHAAFWARKAIDMSEYFEPTNYSSTKDYLFEKSEYYQDCFEIYSSNKKYFDEEKYKYFIFDWEEKFHSPVNHANQNFKYRIHW